MLRVALPNKGQLAEPAKEMLREAGYLRSHSPRDLVVVDPENDVEFFFLRPKDVALYVGAGTLEVGITGRDMLVDSGATAEEVHALGFAPSRFRLAAPPGRFADPRDLAGHRIATSYPSLLRRWLADEGISASVVKLDGAVENAVRLGVADAVADVVDTGTTLRQAGLQLLGEPIMVSEAVVVRPLGAAADPAVGVFLRRLQGVMTARSYVLVDYDIPNDLVAQACALTPGLESPTVASLHETGWSAVRAVVPKADVHRIMDALADLGGRGILVTAILACRL
jgi:ATP phosphoribosyltransferase